MRSTICTSLAALGLGAATVATAAPPVAMTGCYQRRYSKAHLAAHPDQVVAEITLSFDYDPKNDFYPVPADAFGASFDVTFAHQGHVMRDHGPDGEFPTGMGGEEMGNVVMCRTVDGKTRCKQTCSDAGLDILQYDKKQLVIRTRGLEAGDGQDCGGWTEISDHPGKPTTFRLTRVPDQICEGD